MKVSIEKSLATWARTPVRAALAGIAALALLGAPANAQDLETFDPDDAFASAPAQSQPTGGIDADLANPENGSRSAGAWPSATPVPASPSASTDVVTTTAPGFDDEFSSYDETGNAGDNPQWVDPASGVGPANTATETAQSSSTYGEDDLIGAAEGVFGKGAEGLAGLIEDLLREQGEPNAYIVGREAGGAFVLGARYGSGTLHHKVEGQRKVYWTGPSIGFDVGANAANSFVLVYNLYDSEELYERYPAGEGQAYLVGGLHVSYLRKGDVVLIPIRVGAGLRLGVNAGYMKFSKTQRWLPF
ncbi:DUF1134 domain-containing protein [Erythrobacter sp. JK5]|uniref:DUF1134 domain-containing protein n=1 Tax=Erythrobacter sp. JK5 TaxID=2829500 RepID=UPI001BA994B9|nr:DUF1134 domain-containing protein [Erythrobacter sp. JK5]QUL36745.1 DUF1134 domain-containing protein [Erythrobacter sp. JK5]